MPFHKENSALISFLAQVNHPGDWTILNLRYAAIVNFVNMIHIDNVNNFLFPFSLVNIPNLTVKINLSKNIICLTKIPLNI